MWLFIDCRRGSVSSLQGAVVLDVLKVFSGITIFLFLVGSFSRGSVIFVKLPFLGDIPS